LTVKYLSRTRRLVALLLIAALAAVVGLAEAADLQVLSAGAMRSIVTELAAAFEKETGNPVKLTFGTVGVIRAKLAEAAPADVVIMTDDAMKEMARQGAVAEGSWTAIGRTGIGVAVRDGAAKPDISSPDALKQTLLSTKSLVYVDPAQGGTSGIHFAGVLQRLGIADAVKPKTTLVPGGYPAELVAKGDVEMVVHQISEIIPVKGVTLVGPLPKELQKTTVYAAGVTVPSKSKEPARTFVAYLARPDFKPKLAAAGLDYKE
jgi:molybdate transport system substrate-binding protein